MLKYKIAYIDEVEQDRRKFKNYASDDFEVDVVEPIKPISRLLRRVLVKKPQAIIVDYDLVDKKPGLGYMGTDVIEKLKERTEKIPTFILTGYEGDAEDEVKDVNIVYGKKVINNPDNKDFLNRIKKQIENSLVELKQAKIEFNKLKEKSKNKKLTPKEEERLLMLDDFLEKSIDKKNAIPKHLKSLQSFNTLDKMIRLNKRILEQISKK